MQKGALDARRSKLFSILGRMITIQSRLASGDSSNPGLRAAIEKGRKANMTKETIDRAVAKGAPSNSSGQAVYEEVLYEGYGPGGVALIIEGVTDSRNRTSNEIKLILSNHGGSLGGPGSTMWAFASGRNESGEVTYTATSKVPVSDDDKSKLAELVAILEDHQDVKNVAANVE